MSDRGVFSYENRLLLLLGFSFGIAFFDRNAASFLTPFIVDELSLNNTQVGMLQSGLALTWALSAFIIGRWSDRSGVRKPFLIGALVVFSACSVLSGLATTFIVLLLARVIMGIAEGPFLPVCLSIMNVESTPSRRGFNAGVLQNLFPALLGTTLAPVILVWLAEHFNWRVSFFLAGIPGLLLALVVWLMVREPERNQPEPAATGGDKLAIGTMLRNRNIALCALICCFMVAWMILGWGFLPLYFTSYRGYEPSEMSWLIMVLGLGAATSGFVAPALSDRFGRKPIMIAFCLLSMVTPLAALYFQGATLVLAGLLFLGWLGTGSFPIYMGVIPSETIGRRYAATSMGLVVCIGELVGGFAAPTIAGKLADMTSLAAPIVIMVGCGLVSGVLSLFLIETAPSRVAAGTPEPDAA
ncbi:MAG: MFS transporter [Gammaproteobacteria bacterium]|nr:MFS transporter [Gammaproteobacteria bacterium]